MSYLLDTNVCIRFLNDPHSPVAERLRRISRSEVMICDVVKAELYFGVERSARREANQRTLEALFELLPSVPFDGDAARHYGRIKAQLFSAGAPIGPNDLLIAAVALAHRAILVTHNLAEFGRVPGLVVEDWESPVH